MRQKSLRGFIITAFTLLLLYQPRSSWGAFQSLGETVAGNPSCASNNDGTGQVSCAYRGANSGLFGIRFDPRTNFNTGHESLGGVFAGNPSCASTDDNTGQVTCAVRGTTSGLFGIRFDPKTSFTTGFQSLGGLVFGAVFDDPGCASTDDGTGQVSCAVKGPNNGLFGIRFDPKTSFTTGFQSLGGLFFGAVFGNPSCASTDDGTGQVTCAVRNPRYNTLYGIRFNPKTSFSTGFQYLGGTIVGNPSCGSDVDGTGQVTCTARGATSGLFGIRFDPKTNFTTGFQSIGGVFVDDPGCATRLVGEFLTTTCLIKGTDNSLFSISFEPPNVSDMPQNRGGTIGGNPSCAPDFNTGQTICVVKGANNGLFGIAVQF